MKNKQGHFLGWLIPLFIFDVIYYYFIQHLVERNSQNFLVSIRLEPVLFIFVISLLSIACVEVVRKKVALLSLGSRELKYLFTLILSLLVFGGLSMGTQFSTEYFLGKVRSFEYVFNHSIIFLFLHLIVGNAALAQAYFKESQALSEKLLKMEKGQTERELKLLQQQMSPHFLFNNLNTLISLIPLNPDQAIEFTRKLSAIFRHNSQNAKQELISLSEEISFLHDYLRLLEYRFGEAYHLEDDLSNLDSEKFLVVPMALQTLLENVVKHNAGSREAPLKITLTKESDFLVMQNTCRPKKGETILPSQIGLKNLAQQYLLISQREVIIEKNSSNFIVKLPLIARILDERINY